MEGRPSAAIWVSWYMILIYKESINYDKILLQEFIM